MSRHHRAHRRGWAADTGKRAIRGRTAALCSLRFDLDGSKFIIVRPLADGCGRTRRGGWSCCVAAVTFPRTPSNRTPRAWRGRSFYKRSFQHVEVH